MRSWIFAAALVSSLLSSVEAKDTPQRVTGIYSDLTYNSEAGDLLGMELVVVPGPSTTKPDYVAFVQISEGGAPYTAIVPFEIQGSRIEFTLPEGDPAYSNMHFVGALSGSAIVLHLESGKDEILKRGKSYWQ